MPQPLLQDWKEQYIHENYSRALDGEGLVEQVSCPRTTAYVKRPPLGLVGSKLSSQRLRVYCLDRKEADSHTEYNTVILAVWKLMQKDGEFQASLDCVVSVLPTGG